MSAQDVNLPAPVTAEEGAAKLESHAPVPVAPTSPSDSRDSPDNVPPLKEDDAMSDAGDSTCAATLWSPLARAPLLGVPAPACLTPVPSAPTASEVFPRPPCPPITATHQAIPEFPLQEQKGQGQGREALQDHARAAERADEVV